MTDTEIKLILQELHGAGLVNEPKDPKSTFKIWLDFFGGDDFRVIGKAVGMHLKKSHYWPAPADAEKLKTKARWLVEMEDEEHGMKHQLSEVISELYEFNLSGRPSDPIVEVNEWYSYFNSNSIEQVRTAVMRYLELSQVWPEPSQISYFLPTVEEQKKLNALGGAAYTPHINNQSHQPPRAPAIRIESRKCVLHTGDCILLDDLCDGPVDGKWPFEGF